MQTLAVMAQDIFDAFISYPCVSAQHGAQRVGLVVSSWDDNDRH